MRQRSRLLCVAFVTSAMSFMCSSEESPSTLVPVSVHLSSSAGDRLTNKPGTTFGPQVPPQGRPVFDVDESVHYQEIAGFGASFLEAGLVTLNSLPTQAKQDAVLRALFDRKIGAGFSVMKTVIGATDFQSASQEWYTYDDTPGDTALENFSIDRDLTTTGLITYIERARRVGGNFVLQATMDYPPDWMLYDVNSHQNIQPQYYAVLTNYFVKYLREYEKHGVHIDYLSPFNEPGNYTKISFAEIGNFIRDYLGPTFQAEKISTKIQLSEHGTRELALEDYPVVLGDPEVRKYVSVMPYHGYDRLNWDKIALLHDKFPKIPLWMTELCCNNGNNRLEAARAFEGGDVWGNTIVSDLEAGASAWIYWNTILDQNGGPWLVSTVHYDPEENAQESVVIIDRDKHTVTYTGLYYYLAHFSKFVRPGAVRIETKASDAEQLRAISFKNLGGQLACELINSRTVPAEIQLDWHGLSLRATLPPVSITTFLWKP